MPSASLYVVVLNWNGRDDTLACLASLAQSDCADMQVVVVDQGSRDRSVPMIEARFPAVDILQTGSNLGFAGGMNAGIRYALEAGAEHVLLLNNDTIVSPTMIERLTKEMRPGVGVAAPAIFYADSPHEVWSTGGGISPVLYEMTGNHRREEPLPRDPVQRKFLSGCATLISREAFTHVGLFDERFFMYYEDLDYSVRMDAADYQLMLVPDAHLWHKVSRSSGGANAPNERYHMARSSGLYFRKHMHGWRVVPIVCYRGLSALRWTGRLLTQRRMRSLAAYWRGLCAGWLDTRGTAR